MKTRLAAILLAIGSVSCVTDEDDKGAINPSDLAYAGTGLAVVSSAGIDDQFTDDNSSSNSSFNNSNPNSSLNSSNTSGTEPWELDCTGTLTVSGAMSDTLTDNTGCAGGGDGSTQALSWIWGLQTQWQLRIETVPIRSASDTSSFQSDVLFREISSDTGWLGQCTINISDSEGYEGTRNNYAIWTGTADCPDPLTAVEETGEFGGTFVAIDGDPITIESFTFMTPFPQAE